MILVIGLSIPTHAGELEEALPIAAGHAVLIAANDAKICVASTRFLTFCVTSFNDISS